MKATRPNQQRFIAVGAIVVLVVVGFLVWFFLADRQPSVDETAENSPTTSDVSDEAATDPTPVSTNESITPEPEEEAEATVDPETVSRVDIEPLNLSVAYIRGIAGFSYAVERTTAGTRYVLFSAEELAGTKCTDDEGTFASIIESPSEADQATLTATTEVDGDTYGLSLPDATCTSDAELFASYQASFEDAFSLLEKLPVTEE